MSNKFHGIWSPMPTPLGPDGKLNVKRIPSLVNFLIEGGVDGIFPLGSTGEFALLSPEERKMTIKWVVDAVNGRIPVAAGISDTSIDNVVAYAKQAEDIGVDAVVATTPYYFATGDQGVYNHFSAISDKVALPLIMYNIPEYTRNPVSVRTLKRLANERKIIAMKYTENNLARLLQYLEACGDKIQIFNGSFALTYSCLSFGGAGSVVAVANIVPTEASSIYDAFKRGDLAAAKTAQRRLSSVEDALMTGIFPAGLKYAMALVGQPVGGPKPPIPSLTDAEKSQVRRILKNAGIKLNHEAR